MSTHQKPVDRRFRFRPIRLSGLVASYNVGGVVVSESNGLWTVQCPAAQDPLWEFGWPVAPVPGRTILAVRLRDFTHPAAAQDLRVAIGTTDGAGGLRELAGLRYPAGTANMNACAYDEDFGWDDSVAEARADVERVIGWIAGDVSTTAGAIVAYLMTPTAQREASQRDISFHWNTRSVLVSNGAGVAQTVQFRPEYCLINLDEIPG